MAGIRIDIKEELRKEIIDMIKSDLPHKKKKEIFTEFIDYISGLIEDVKQFLESALDS